MTLPSHFLSETPTHTLPEGKWFSLSRNPTLESFESPGLSFDEHRVRRYAESLMLRNDRPASKQERLQFRGFYFYDGKVLSSREACIMLRLSLDGTTYTSVEEVHAQIEQCITDTAPLLSRDALTKMLAAWIKKNFSSGIVHNMAPARMSHMLRDYLGMLQAIELVLEVYPPGLMFQGLKPLATYHLDKAARHRIEQRVLSYIRSHRSELLPDCEVELIRLAPAQEAVEFMLSRDVDTNAIIRARVTTEHRNRALFAVQDAALFRRGLYELERPYKLAFSPAHLIMHIHHLGFDDFERVVPELIAYINTWNLMEWGICFKIKHGALTEFMLRIIKDEKRYQDMLRLANAWLYEGGRQVITRCIELACGHHDLRDIALDTLETYAKLGHAELIIECMETLRGRAGTFDADTVAIIEEFCTTHPRQGPPEPTDALPHSNLPSWLVKWIGRGLKPKTPTHLTVEHFPKLTLQSHPSRPLGRVAITGMLRYLQQHAGRDPKHAYRVHNLLTQDSRQALYEHLNLLWSVQHQRAVHAWLANTCATLMSKDVLAPMLERYSSGMRPSIYGRHRNWDAEMLLASELPEALDVIIARQHAHFTKTHTPIVVRPILRRIIELEKVNLVTLLTRHVTQQPVHGGRQYINSRGRVVQVTYQNTQHPVCVWRDTGELLDERDAAHIDETYLATEREKILDIYQNLPPRITDTKDRSWSYQDWRSDMDHPLIAQIHRAILWQLTPVEGEPIHVRCLEDLTLYDHHDQPVPTDILLGCRLQIADVTHFLEETRLVWGLLFAEEEQEMLLQEL